MTRRQLKRFFQRCSDRTKPGAKYSTARPFLCTQDHRVYATDGRICVRTLREADWAEATEMPPPVTSLPWDVSLYRQTPIIIKTTGDENGRFEDITLKAYYVKLLCEARIRNLRPSLKLPLISALYFKTRQLEGLLMPMGST